MRPREKFKPFICQARPSINNGNICGHRSVRGSHFRGHWCCDKCGTPRPKKPKADVETTEAGPQILIDGIASVTVREKLAILAARPMQPKRLCVQKPCNIGLFDEDARNQLDLF